MNRSQYIISIYLGSQCNRYCFSLPMEPARAQVTKEELDRFATDRNLEVQAAQGPNAVLNTWYRKWSGGTQANHRPQRSPFRCQLARDSGATKARSPYICLWFARGACLKGSDCPFLHRAPEESDIMQIDSTTDCFGRPKFAEYRDDMGGVGSFLSPNRTLFVGYFAKPPKQLKEQFAEWGDLAGVQVKGSVAFVTYRLQLSAEFAKEAMSNQTVTGTETLSIRWSNRAASAGTGIDEGRVRQIVRQVLKMRRARPAEAEGTESRKKIVH